IGTSPQPGDATNTRFSLNVVVLKSNGSLSIVEAFNNLSVSQTDPRYVLTVINADSNYVTATAVGTPPPAPPNSFPPSNPPPPPFKSPPFLSGGLDGFVLDPTQDTADLAPFQTALNADNNSTGGVHLLDEVDIFNLLCVPGDTSAVVIQNLQQYC